MNIEFNLKKRRWSYLNFFFIVLLLIFEGFEVFFLILVIERWIWEMIIGKR